MGYTTQKSWYYILLCAHVMQNIRNMLFPFTFCLHSSNTVLFLLLFHELTLSTVHLEHILWFRCSSPEYQRHMCIELDYQKKHAVDLTMWLKDFMQVLQMNVWSNCKQMYFVLATWFACIYLSNVYRVQCDIKVLVSVCFRIWMAKWTFETSKIYIKLT